ncbi:MAG: 4Fe-4S dicluster domain-containing protein [Bacillota bacterium]
MNEDRRRLTLHNSFHHDPDFVHVAVKDTSVCERKCKEHRCVSICPSGVFVLAGNEGLHAEADYRYCVECGACRLVCPFDNVYLVLPRGGFGIEHRHG